MICVSVLSNLATFFDNGMDLDNGTSHHPLRFNQSNQSKQADPSKTSQWMIALRNAGKYGLYRGSSFLM